MPRYKHYEYDQSLLLPVNFSEQIMPVTLEYTINYLVEEKIDIAPLEERSCNEENGAPAYDPKMLLKIIILAYSRGVNSTRRIEKLCKENIIFQALTAGTQPDFTTIAHFVRSMRDEVRFLFSDILLYCNELDLLSGTTFALDGCKLSSNASKEHSGTFADLKKKKEKLGKTLKLIMKQHRENDLKDKENRKRQKERIKKTKRKIERIDRFLAENKPKAKSRQGERQSNITDNESAKIKTSKGVIDAFIPDQQFRKRDPRFVDRDRYKSKKDSLYTKEDFIFRKKTNDSICPEGKILKFHTRQTFNNTEGRVFRAKQSECKNCTRREKCVRSENTRQRSLYVIEKYFNRNYSEEMKAKIDTPEGKNIYSMRMGIIEPVFGNICNAMRLNHFTLRTKAKVNVQWVLYCILNCTFSTGSTKHNRCARPQEMKLWPCSACGTLRPIYETERNVGYAATLGETAEKSLARHPGGLKIKISCFL